MEKKESKNVSGRIKKTTPKVYAILVLFCVIVVSIVLYRIYNNEEKYLVDEGVIKYTTTSNAYIIKSETVIDIDANKILVPSVSEGARVSKNNIVATYRGAEYQEYQEKLKQLDLEILNAMKDINVEYSVDISNLETQVVNMISNAQGTSSMIDMQESKTNINNILSKRASMIGELSPKDAYVKELINKRKSIESQMASSTSNIKAPIGGIVSYTVDGFEDKLTKNNVLKLNYEDIKEHVSHKEDISANKIRITSNYEAYILTRISDVQEEYIKEGNMYEIAVVGTEQAVLNGEIVKITKTEQGDEVLFRVTNGIENIVDTRECEIEVAWTSYEGLIVPNKAIFKGQDKKDYVRIITRGDYVDIPVKVEEKNKTYSIVSNYEQEKPNSYVLERYDQVVISENQYY